MKKALVTFGFLFLLILFNETASAQWALGASYEIRSEVPENGFGLRVEREFLSEVPILDFGARAHFSYFNAENNVRFDDIVISQDIKAYDYGLAALAGIKLGLVKPYVGFGIGNQQYKYDANSDAINISDDSSFYWNGFGGAEVTLLPFLRPFLEYRIANLTSTDDVDFENISRLAIGVNLRF